MRPDVSPTPIRLADYAPPAWVAEHVDLTFDLAPRGARVRARIRFVKGPGEAAGGPLRLDGQKLRLLSAAVDGTDALPSITVDEEGLTLAPADNAPLPDAFTWEAEVEIDPEANTELEGLYLSNGVYCTQCEAEGFRKITYFPDRPDVMATYAVRIEAPTSIPVLLSNGEPGATGPLPGDRHFAEWTDPWPKPSYLFALVAGELVAHTDAFTTASGRPVALAIHVRPGDEDRCAYAMDALKRSMRWDETEYGREYDLSVFNIVAVDDFNMGAMENKGLNVFNSKYVLASPETATDRDYELIEGIIAHEYFHNWTGNRITCRDWFQLCLKEGLTVFRDQQFSADMRSEAVQRIDQVKMLRARQFREDAGPLAHPVRPEEFIEINNFYTATVYEKGAELIRMLRLIVGAETYRAALDLYFDRHDGQACTIEDWIAVFEDASGRDLTRFRLWYAQAGTPRVTVSEGWVEDAPGQGGRYTLTLRQETPSTPGQPLKKPVPIPVAFGLLGADGRELIEPGVLELDDTERCWSFELPERPVPSLLRGFSAPVILERRSSEAERAFLLAHDRDPFNRWEAARALALEVMMGAASADAFAEALLPAITDASLDPAFRALLLTLPGEDEIARETWSRGRPADPDAIHAAAKAARKALAEALEPELRGLYEAMETPGPYTPEAGDAGRRALRAAALGLLARLPVGAGMAEAQCGAANMSDRLPALAALLASGSPAADAALDAFAADWRHDPLVMDKWRMLQATASRPDTLARVKALSEAPDFPWKTPNRFRSLVAAFAQNPCAFHQADGSGYRFLADWLIRLDPVNPQTAARVAGAFETWRRYDAKRQKLIRAELSRIAATEGLSRDMAEIVSRMLDA
ncbi:aminopeptidase N [Albimonas donghaensis]|uniref:Aminopeptidase N n=1 Tax=Albimonas donghaensis TaxID=356660 RepID=A0A1H2QT66_9RHOB|nr:aminopeptidase N [Albimonas donghaensis]SDW10363.1 aminopeptidase N [Albimonas donghaensis]